MVCATAAASLRLCVSVCVFELSRANEIECIRCGETITKLGPSMRSDWNTTKELDVPESHPHTHRHLAPNAVYAPSSRRDRRRRRARIISNSNALYRRCCCCCCCKRTSLKMTSTENDYTQHTHIHHLYIYSYGWHGYEHFWPCTATLCHPTLVDDAALNFLVGERIAGNNGDDDDDEKREEKKKHSFFVRM